MGTYGHEGGYWMNPEQRSSVTPWWVEFFRDIGARERGKNYILDEFDHDFYLRFNTEY